MESIRLEPIGVVRSALATAEQAPRQGPEAGLVSVIEIAPAWRQGLTGLSPGRDLWVIYHFHQAQATALMTHPRHDPARALTGVFNTRSPKRPAHLGLTLVRLLQVDQGRLTVRGLEALDGTPVLDIKPYVPGLDQPAPLEEP
ncbi:MAG: tRNA (N6-threonylcarbamoyladenosine(37)-N6)-methyltransferase TrmO [Desulfarculus sp.]|nr:tRNA (N6-threonylcarbamoyladenosine(37)-N6)-methyltransferase TrmO [Desulfarculus sp.]